MSTPVSSSTTTLTTRSLDPITPKPEAPKATPAASDPKHHDSSDLAHAAHYTVALLETVAKAGEKLAPKSKNLIMKGVKTAAHHRGVGVGGAVLAAGLEAKSAYAASSAQTTAGKAISAAVSGAAAIGLGPVVAIADLALPESVKIGKTYRGAIDAAVVVGESLVTGEVSGLIDFHRASLRGDKGALLIGSARLGRDLVPG